MTSASRRIISVLLFTGLLVVLVNLAWWFYYQKTRDMLDEQLSRRLAAVAISASIALPPGEIEQLVADSLDAYLNVLAILQSVQRSDSLSEVFIVDENHRYLVTTALEPDTTYFLSELNGPLIDSLFFGLTLERLLTPTYQTGKLFLKSAFVPLVGVDGYVIAVLGVEANVDYFDSLGELRRNLYLATALSLIGGLVLGLLFLLLQRRVNKSEQQLFLGETHAHLGRMVAVVSHELKNPLMIIRGSAERILKKTGQEEAKYVLEEVDRLDGIARSEGSLLAGDTRQPVDLAKLTGNIRIHLQEKYADQKIIWLSDQEYLSIVINGYPRSLRQVLLNLLLNGVESCREAGLSAEVGLELSETASDVTITVIDHGPGLSRKDVRKVLTPFYTTKRSGSGLGLYLSSRIVDEMCGEMTIESEPGVVTRVIVRLAKEV